ncbi:hypothetical protein NE237_006322 [Protea cynaroides]|uniref:Uncharacterized protein n=1 Tax=Protea cynaroides TaxID=273540 RepID=A0A9Q0KM45_9MAGN|nr:hypothetical protein NE237_006322 [Protea cynaroides]
MRREGRQHGMVKTYVVFQDWIAAIPYYDSTCKVVNKFDPPLTAGEFMKVSSKPTNHSKSLGKCTQKRCWGCRFHPVYKSKDKAKGSHKERYYDLLSSIAWNRVGLNYARLSATTILGQLSNRHDHWDDNYDEDGEEEEGRI